MWTRPVEILFALWLMFSPFIFSSEPNSRLAWIDITLAAGIMASVALSYLPKLSHAYLVNLFIALGLILWGRFAASEPNPIHQNHIIVGFLLLSIALLPHPGADDESVKDAPRSLTTWDSSHSKHVAGV